MGLVVPGLRKALGFGADVPLHSAERVAGVEAVWPLLGAFEIAVGMAAWFLAPCRWYRFCLGALLSAFAAWHIAGIGSGAARCGCSTGIPVLDGDAGTAARLLSLMWAWVHCGPDPPEDR